MRRRVICFFMVVSLSVGVSSFFKAYAQDESAQAGIQEVSETDSEVSSGNLRSEIVSDIQGLKDQRDEIKSNSQSALSQEMALRQQIAEALRAGDFTTADQLKAQLKTTHQENLEQKQQDMQGLKDARQEIKQDIQAARQVQMPSDGQMIGKPFEPSMRKPGEPDIFDRREDVRDRREDFRDRREDVMDRKEDKWDAAHNPPVGTEAYRRDKLEDVRDRREDFRDRREDIGDRREDIGDHGMRKPDMQGQGMGAGPQGQQMRRPEGMGQQQGQGQQMRRPEGMGQQQGQGQQMRRPEGMGQQQGQGQQMRRPEGMGAAGSRGSGGGGRGGNAPRPGGGGGGKRR